MRKELRAGCARHAHTRERPVMMCSSLRRMSAHDATAHVSSGPVPHDRRHFWRYVDGGCFWGPDHRAVYRNKEGRITHIRRHFISSTHTQRDAQNGFKSTCPHFPQRARGRALESRWVGGLDAY